MAGLMNNPGLFGLGTTAALSTQVTHVRLKNTMYNRNVESIELLKLSNGVTMTPEQMHNNIRLGLKYHTLIGTERATVLPAMRETTKYVRTNPDSTTNDNLLRLPQF